MTDLRAEAHEPPTDLARRIRIAVNLHRRILPFVDREAILDAAKAIETMASALAPFAKIADAWDANKSHEIDYDLRTVSLRVVGPAVLDAELLTLADAFAARGALDGKPTPPDTCSKCRALDPQGVFLCPEHSKPVYVADHVEVTEHLAPAVKDPHVAATLDRFAGWSFEPELDAPVTVNVIRSTPAENAGYEAAIATAKKHAEVGTFSVDYTAMAVFQDGLRAYRAATPPVEKVTYVAPPGYALVPQVAIDWLDGAAADDEGKWFGDREEEAAHRGPHSVKRPAFWFRSAFRKIIDRVGPPRRDLVADRPTTRLSFSNDIDYLQQADAHRDEGTLGERAARSILDIALHWCHALKSQQEVHATLLDTIVVGVPAFRWAGQIAGDRSWRVEVDANKLGEVLDAMTSSAAQAIGLLEAIAIQRNIKNRGMSDRQLDVVDDILGKLREAFKRPKKPAKPPETKTEPPIDAAAESFAASEGLAPPRPVPADGQHAPDCATKCRQQKLHKHDCDCGAAVAP